MLPCTAAKGKVTSTLAERADAPETDQGRTWRDDEPQCLTQPPHRAHAAQADRAERRSERSMGISSHTRHRKKSCRFARCSRGLDEKTLSLSTEATPSLVTLSRARPARGWGVCQREVWFGGTMCVWVHWDFF